MIIICHDHYDRRRRRRHYDHHRHHGAWQAARAEPRWTALLFS